MSDYEAPMKTLYGCLIIAGMLVGGAIVAILWWLSRS